MKELSLERSEEALDGGVVVAVSLAAHRARDAVAAKPHAVFVRCVLAAPVRVMHQVAARHATLERWPSLQRRTGSCLNSSLNFRLFLRAIDTSYPIGLVSVEAGEVQLSNPPH
jgi:hypothetical protein